ncbi:hypothetical protein EDB83DRAFT_2528627 [Lactarius deliciosus]|nr:hypothetical protein EDB83DRAFT_2528627 [Lactarius deliciosus]
MLRWLTYVEQPSRVDAAPLRTATHIFDHLREGRRRRGLRGDPATPSGRHSRLQKCAPHSSAVPRRQRANITQSACRFNQRPGRARAQEGSGNAPPPHPIRAGAFALRVQALIADNRTLMECLIRFAQAHDPLKKNAEHAQKLAQDSNAALETYQRQVRTLEEQLAMSDGLQEQVDQLAVEKLAVEERAAEQAEALHQLTEAKAVLSARALQLAEDPAPAQEELRAVNTVSEREQMQRLALLEEINVVQMENGSLR